jgi:hypothetical protein
VGIDIDPNIMLYVDVNIGPGQSSRIEVRTGDDPEALAQAFATVHHLAPHMASRLTSLLRQQIEQFHIDEAAAAAAVETTSDPSSPDFSALAAQYNIRVGEEARKAPAPEASSRGAIVPADTESDVMAVFGSPDHAPLLKKAFNIYAAKNQFTVCRLCGFDLDSRGRGFGHDCAVSAFSLCSFVLFDGCACVHM